MHYIATDSYQFSIISCGEHMIVLKYVYTNKCQIPTIKILFCDNSFVFCFMLEIETQWSYVNLFLKLLQLCILRGIYFS